jgi:hypothetical protein
MLFHAIMMEFCQDLLRSKFWLIGEWSIRYINKHSLILSLMIFSYHVIIWFVKTVGHALQIVSLERLSVFVLQDSTESTVLSAVSFSKDKAI